MLAPKKVKYRKQQKGRRGGTAWRGSSLAFGDYGLQVVDRGWLTAREIEAARVALTRAIKRGGRVLVRVVPRQPPPQEAGRNPHGQGQGVARDVGRGREARSHALRDGGCRPRVRAQRAQAGGGEAVAAHADARASCGHGGRAVKLRDLKDLSLDELKH